MEQTGNEMNNNFKGDILLLFITLKKYKIWRHLLMNTALIVLVFALKIPDEYEGIYDYLDTIFGIVLLSALFYTNLYVITPQILFKGKLIQYILSLSLVISIAGLISYGFHDFLIDRYRIVPLAEERTPINSVVVALIVFMPMIAFSTSIKFFQKWYTDNLTMHDLEVKAKESELEALRNQIQPHFLFNMLNSIKILIRREPEKAEQITMKLSDFLRHLLYDNKLQKVFLSSEMRFLKDYLILEKMRRDEFEYTVEYDETALKGIQIPPNLLLILVENAVKHSLDPQDESYIDIQISTNEKELCILITNSVPHTSLKARKEGGVGLANIQRRLELLYGNRYYLNSNKNRDEYIATLKLPI